MSELTQWFSTADFRPAHNGWYEVEHLPCGFTGNHGYAHWDGKEWRRNYGWPADGNKKVWTIVNGVLQLPVVDRSFGTMSHEYALRCSSPVQVVRFRGFEP